MRDLAYLRLLAREYPNVQAASSEIINLMGHPRPSQGNGILFQ